MERAKRMTLQAGGPRMPPEADDKIMQNPGIWAFPWS
jgi:hypothetical protein